MSVQERILYHQIHPLKFFTDWFFGFFCLYFVWIDVISFACIAFLLMVIVSYLLIQYASLDEYKHSSLGRYVHKHMSTAMQALRLVGFFVMVLGSSTHMLYGIIIGVFFIVIAWGNGFLAATL